MVNVNPILLAVPLFFVLMALEGYVLRKRTPAAYGAADTLQNLACGIGSQLTGLGYAAMSLVVYNYVLHHFALFDLSAAPGVAWALALVGVDFLYYWWHRASHRVNFLWAMHAVHHQSERYNLSVALRQSWFSGIFSWAFYLPLAFLGVPFGVYAASAALSLLYQFWIHTEAIGKLGPLEGVLNTPSHHRVHHGSNERYLDKNYAASLIVWDKLFGTFEPERDRPRYGVVEKLGTWNALRANTQPWQKLWRARHVHGWRIGFAGPEKLSASAEPKVLATPTRLTRPVFFFSLSFLSAVGALYGSHALPAGAVIALGAISFYAMTRLGTALDAAQDVILSPAP